MKKQLTIVAALMFAMACKTDAPSQSSSAPAGDDSSAKARSAKIDVKPVQPPPAPPQLPAQPDDTTEPPHVVPPAANDRVPRGEWRQRRDARLDTNGDGVISGEERDAALKNRMMNMRSRLDTDGDGKLSPDELAHARGRMRFDDPAALDTNHDGDISAEELAAGFRARRDQFRNARGSGSGSGTTP